MCHEMVRQGGWVEEENIDVSFHLIVLSQDLKLIINNVLGVFFHWCPPKNSKCRPEIKFCHLELF